MPTYSFSNTIPAANHKPGSDQPVMLANNVAMAGIIAVDHIGFNAANGGMHKQVSMINETSPAIGTANAVLYANGNQVKFKNSSVDVQLTSSVTPLAAANGYTFLPGGILLQWGTATFPGSPVGYVDVTFSRAFSLAPWNVTASLGVSPGTDSSRGIGVINITSSGCRIQNWNCWVLNGPVYWLAIGPV